jgi:hypothetical protein
MDVDWGRKTLQATTADSYLVWSGLRLDPLQTPILSLSGSISGDGAGKNWTCIYWASASRPGFDESHKITFFWPMDGAKRSLSIHLDRILRLSLERPIVALRFDFTGSPARIELDQFAVHPE